MSRIKLISLVVIFIIATMTPSTHSATQVSTNIQGSAKSPAFVTNSQQAHQLVGKEAFVFKLLTYNIRFTGEFDAWRDVVVEENADILQLSETSGWTTVENEDFQTDLSYINEKLQSMGYEPYRYYNVTYEPPTLSGGAAIISRFPILATHQIDTYQLDDGTVNEFQHPLLHAIVEINGTEVHTIGAVHLTPGETGHSQRMVDIEAALNYIDALGPVPFIFNGDFNTASPEDTGKFKWQSTNLDPAALAQILDEDNPKTSVNHTWIDAYRTLNPRTFGYTYEYLPWVNRIDYIFVNQFFFDKIILSTTGDTPSADRGSDHYAVDVTINMQPDLVDLRPPFRVHGLDLRISTPTDIELIWEENEANDTSHYHIYRNNTLQESPLTTQFEDILPDENQVYVYEVAATDDNNNTGLRSDPVYYQPNLGRLTPPGIPTVQGEGRPGQIYLNWTVDDDGGFDILYYLVIRATEASIERNIYRVEANTTDTEFTDDIDLIDNTYFYQVVAVNILGKGQVSPLIELRAGETDAQRDGVPINSVIPFVAILAIVITRRWRFDTA